MFIRIGSRGLVICVPATLKMSVMDTDETSGSVLYTDSVDSVSYTHLDVYKRQVFHVRIQPDPKERRLKSKISK